MKKIVFFFLMFLHIGVTYAQTEAPIQKRTPSKGDIQFNLVVGETQNFGEWFQFPDKDQSTYTVISPALENNPLDEYEIDMVGVEFKYFITDQWAIRFCGAGVMDANPAYEGTPGLEGSLDDDGNVIEFTDLPTYSSVPSRSESEMLINLGADRYFNTRNPYLSVYTGATLNFHYARKSGFEVGGETLDPVEMGTTRYAEALGMGASLLVGTEYYFTPGLFAGFEVSPVNYMYTWNRMLPEEGLEVVQADNHNIAFFSQIVFRLGIKF